MVRLTVTLTETTPGLLARKMTERCTKLVEADRKLRRHAATRATEVTRASFINKRVANVPARLGRLKSGRMRAGLRWKVGANGMVDFDVRYADREAKFWIIQEIGTGGPSATMRQGGSLTPGHPAVGPTRVRAVPAQTGRPISSGLVWATGPRGSYSAPGSATGQQLYLRSRIRSVSRNRGQQTAPIRPHGIAMHIGHEIHGQHFVRKGGTEAFREYHISVLAAAQAAFSGHSRP